ncbi:MAG: hypothetical protein M3Q08_04635 [Pseudomonadota bacterium]|nr:hypothetical protein [Pseudomonadota bacterium]
MVLDRPGEVPNFVCEFSTLFERQRTGPVPQQLAAWAAILALPTAIGFGQE